MIRVYKIDSAPSSLTWDEAAVGYNAWTIANYGRDEYGKLFPIYFRSFGEDKQPIHIYITALFVKFLDLSEFSTRMPAAVFGTINVLLIFYLARSLFNNSYIGLLSSFFLAISPHNIHFSKFNHEANFALFFFMFGLLLFFYSLKKNKSFLSLSILSFILSMISYHAAEIAVPPVILLLGVLYAKNLTKEKINILISLILLLGFILLAIFQPRLLGVNRFNQTVQGKNDIEKTLLFNKTQNLLLGRVNLIFSQYLSYFNPKFLFISGDKNSRLSAQGAGEFYKIDAVFLIIGVICLLYKRSKEGLLIVGWALIAPLPGSVVGEAPHAGRAMFMMGSWHIISAIGFFSLVGLLKKKIFKWFLATVFIAYLMISLSEYLKYYYGEFTKRYAIDWQYGMKQIAQYANEHKEYDQVYITSIRSQPYIFLLYYLKIPLPVYLDTVIYNNSKDKSSNNVSLFGKYSFGGWNSIESPASKGVLYVLSPSEYDGLAYKFNYDIKNIIYYPNRTTAFYLVSLK
ncbi:glycosyltransferase family 39 protein [Candidatus Daviesbacteria bacterium]|nr:glycosyltransferase family 39 protein [Candidatus Daviesbacteria bacterium]